MTDTIHQEIRLPGTPARVYAALMDAEEHAAFTGGPAEIDARPGGAFRCHGGQIQGRTIELEPGRRIVQAWRVAQWDAGLYTLIRIELEADDEQTRLTLDHSGVPEAFRAHLDAGWHARYWKPLAKHLAR